MFSIVSDLKKKVMKIVEENKEADFFIDEISNIEAKVFKEISDILNKKSYLWISFHGHNLPSSKCLKGLTVFMLLTFLHFYIIHFLYFLKCKINEN